MIILLFGTDVRNKNIFDIDRAKSIMHKYGHTLSLELEKSEINWQQKAWNFDVAFSLYYMYKVPEFITKKPIINIHPGILPQYAGRGLCYQAIMNKEKEFGVTAHYMEPEFDTGDIIAQKTFKINDTMNAGNISDICSVYANTMFLELLTEICITNTFLQAIEQDISKRKYYRFQDIDENVVLTPEQQLKVRAICTNEHPAKTNINGVKYIIQRARA